MKRWGIAFAGFCLQMSLGAAYAWSVFRIPLSRQFGWTISEVTNTFTLSWFALGCVSVLGGMWLKRTAPHIVAIAGAALWSTGVFLASYSSHGLWCLYLSYGAIGGAGLGIGYIVPISVLVKWFPDRRGFITGLAVAGFGGGSLIAAPIASDLIARVGPLRTFAYLGAGYAMVSIPAAFFMRNPPLDWSPAHWMPSAKLTSQRSHCEYTLRQAVNTWQWWALCALLSLNTIAGLSIMSQAAPIFEEMGKTSAAAAARFVGIISIGNGLGRLLWSWFSDATSRRIAFFTMFLVEAGLYSYLHDVESLKVLLTATFILAVCYGGAYGITPAFAADYFGSRDIGAIFGLMMLPWAFMSAFGTFIVAHLRQVTGTYTEGFHLIGGMMAAALILPIIICPPRGFTNGHIEVAAGISRTSQIRH